MTLHDLVEMLTKLGPAYAWPVAALIAMPFVLWKVHTISGALTSLHALVADKTAVASLLQNVKKLSDLIDKLKDAQEELRNTQLALQVQKFEKETVQEQAETISQLSSQEDPPHQALPSDASRLSVEEMRATVNQHWRELESLLREKFTEAGIEVDFRSPRTIGVAVAQLSERDGRKRQQLKTKDAEPPAALASVARSINKNSEQLTQDLFEQYGSAADGLKKKVRGWWPGEKAAIASPSG